LLNYQEPPLIVELEELGIPDYIGYSYRTHSYNNYGEDQSKPDDVWKRYAYTRNGFRHGWKKIRELAAKDDIELGPSTNKSKASTAFSKQSHSFRNGFSISTLEIYANRAACHFGHMLLLSAGANASHLSSIDFSKTRLDKEVGTNRIIAIKGRSNHEQQTLTIDSRFVHSHWKQYLKLREWMAAHIDKQAPEQGIFTLTRKGKKGFVLLDADKLSQDIFWPKEAPKLVTRVGKKYKTTTMLEDSDGDTGLVSQLTSTSESTVRKHYTFKKAEDAAKQLSVFFNSMAESAQLRVSGEAVAPVVENAPKVTVGRCTAKSESDIQPIEGYDNRAPQPRCGAPVTCFFCESFGVHADEEDITRLMSVKVWIEYQSESISRNVDEHHQKFLPIIYRIDEIIEQFAARNKYSQSIVDASNQRILRGQLDSYWKNKIDALIDSMEA